MSSLVAVHMLQKVGHGHSILKESEIHWPSRRVRSTRAPPQKDRWGKADWVEAAPKAWLLRVWGPCPSWSEWWCPAPHCKSSAGSAIGGMVRKTWCLWWESACRCNLGSLWSMLTIAVSRLAVLKSMSEVVMLTMLDTPWTWRKTPGDLKFNVKRSGQSWQIHQIVFVHFFELAN